MNACKKSSTLLSAAIAATLATFSASSHAGNSATGFLAFVGGGDANSASAAYSTIAGGHTNTITVNGGAGTIGGGDTNTVSALDATALGGLFNTASANYATVCGGYQNTANQIYGWVGGGYKNKASGSYSSMAGGSNNLVTGDYGTVSGGITNTASANLATISGGEQNLAQGLGAIVPGGRLNDANGDYSFAGGLSAHVRSAAETGDPAAHPFGDQGSFVWADAMGYSASNQIGTAFETTGPNQFLVRANGGVGLNDNPVNARVGLSIASTSSNPNYANIFMHQGNSDNGILMTAGDATTGQSSTANDSGFYIDQYNGTTQTRRLSIDTAGNLKVGAQAYKPGGGAWAASSDARLKKNVQPLEHPLERLLALRGVTFEYSTPDAGMHPAGEFTGFIAQEVQKNFPNWIGHDENGFLTVGPQGFEALTVEALRQMKSDYAAQVKDVQAENAANLHRLEAENAALREQIKSELATQASSIADMRRQLTAMSTLHNRTDSVASTAP